MPDTLKPKGLLTPSSVNDLFRSFDKTGRKDVQQLISRYPYWVNEDWPIHELGKVSWYVDPDLQHISQVLTCHGDQCTLEYISNQFINYKCEVESDFPWFTRKIDAIIASIRSGALLPPIIISSCRFRSKYYVLDGFHRSLALLVNQKTTSPSKKLVNVYIGYDAGLSIVKKMIRKVSPA